MRTDRSKAVFEAWRERQERPDLVKYTTRRRDMIRRRMNGGHTPADLITLIRYAYEADVHEARFWRGEGGGRTYLGLDNLLRAGKLDDRVYNAKVWADEQVEREADDVNIGLVGRLRRDSRQ